MKIFTKRAVSEWRCFSLFDTETVTNYEITVAPNQVELKINSLAGGTLRLCDDAALSFWGQLCACRHRREMEEVEVIARQQLD